MSERNSEVCSGSRGVEARAHERSRKLLARVKDPALHGGLGNADYPADLGDGIVTVVEQFDDFPMSRGELVDARPQDALRFLAVEGDIRRIPGVDDCKRIVPLDSLVRSLPPRVDGLEPGDREQLCGNARATLEPVCRAPHIEEYLIDEILDDRLIANQALDESRHPFAVAGKDDVHGSLVALRNALEQHLVANVFPHDAAIHSPIARCVSRTRLAGSANGINQPITAHRAGESIQWLWTAADGIG